MRNRRWYVLAVGFLASVALCTSTASASASTRQLVTVWNKHSNLCMSVPGDKIKAGALVNQYDCGYYPDQYWNQETSDSHQGWFYFQPQQDNTLCVTYAPGSTAQLTLQYCGTNAANGNVNTQLWLYNPTAEDLATVQGWAMSVPGASTIVDPINIYPYGPYPDQSWFVINEPEV
ncbi:Ricin-type beta-trefoil lectin domain-containing protein [Actinacidiphila rubida]|uniref:Ricin-type beta-trefoil lectin domain-containing protein n=1 Tax=Actinacidiphila rubida TaxID=310780 RepID=A0A1H8KHK0_9ACTN|nr:Ricin-type beta-trefoil lectin domain-containing protein [Actinacidiphila rubida]